ncbi:MAG TPA: XdhC/CoxI family protein [Opitutaceae bacterium]|nr:XdhC/CoxI family protein [Opitutaceae bacterium]
MKEFSAILQRLAGASGPSALATLVRVDGSSYRRPGARLLVTPDGERTGSISGGCLEEDVAEHARAVLASGKASLVVYDTTTENDLAWGVGLGCHGVVRVLIEKLPPAPAWAGALLENFRQRASTDLVAIWEAADSALLGTRLAAEMSALPRSGLQVFRETVQPPVPLVVCGAGDDARPLVRLAKELGWHVTVADPRPAFATAARFPEADAVVVARPEDIAVHLPPDARTLAVVMTHHYRHDLPFLRALLPIPLTYLGLLGPKKRSEKILSDLAAGGFAITAEQRARLHAPVGLDLGGDAPEAVALAVLAEMQAVLSGRDAHPLRERTRPIHA